MENHFIIYEQIYAAATQAPRVALIINVKAAAIPFLEPPLTTDTYGKSVYQCIAFLADFVDLVVFVLYERKYFLRPLFLEDLE